MVDRPHNHVADAMSSVRGLALGGHDLAGFPPIPEALLRHLEKLFPPRCYRADERPEVHLLYAGKSELVEVLRAAYEGQHEMAELSDEALEAMALDALRDA